MTGLMRTSASLIGCVFTKKGSSRISANVEYELKKVLIKAIIMGSSNSNREAPFGKLGDKFVH